MAGKLGRALVLLVLLAAALITQAPLAVFLLAFALVLLVLLRLDAAYLRRQVTAELLVPDKPVIQGEDFPLTVRLRNRSRLPIPALVVLLNAADEWGGGQITLRCAAMLGGRERAEQRITLNAGKSGVWSIAVRGITLRDHLGVFTVACPAAVQSRSICVLPAAAAGKAKAETAPDEDGDEADTRGAVQQYAEACYTGPRRLDVVELPGTPWGKLYRRTLFERVRFPSGYTCFEDAMIHFWVFPRAKCIASTKPVVYLWHKNTMGLTATSQNTAKALQAYWVAEEMLDGAVRLGLPQDALFACNLILQLANYCYVCVAGLPEADRQTAFACCCLLYRRWAKKLPDVALPYAVRLAQRALEQADYGLWQLQGRLFQLIN